MSKNINLRTAKRVKNDEFYTKLEDVEAELCHYDEFLKGKIVYCNADNPYQSNFFKYFLANFNRIGLKRVIATNYSGNKQLSLLGQIWGQNKQMKSYKAVVNVVDNFTSVEEILKDKRNHISTLKGNGDFRSRECREILKEADVVVTNPPFSLFSEYITLLVDYEKDFILLGNINAVTYSKIFPYILEDKIRLGYVFHKNIEFAVPDYSDKWDRIDENGVKYRAAGNAAWYTTFPINRRPKSLILTKKYSPEKYPRYDNYDAINVDRVVDIPKDYDGLMGVPITYLGHHDPKRFEIVGIDVELLENTIDNRELEFLDKNGKGTGKYIKTGAKVFYLRYDIKRHKCPSFKDVKTGELFFAPYKRIIIKRKLGKNNKDKT